jgi:hypothetical protein
MFTLMGAATVAANSGLADSITDDQRKTNLAARASSRGMIEP